MYETHFGLRQRPFRPAPDAECYYAATSHEHALARLLQALGDEEGLVLLTGLPGTGKTLLCHCLLERLGPEVASVFITNSHLSDRQSLLQAILFDLSLPYEGRGEQELRLALTDCLLKNYGTGRRTLVIVDEAHHLEPDLLEELRLLGNLEARKGKAVQIVLAAQPCILEAIARPELDAFRQRLAVRAPLEPLPLQEAADYLIHRLRVAGGRADAIIADEALGILARGSHGIPRLLNQAAHQALVLAHSAGAPIADAEAALEALSSLGLESEETNEEADSEPLLVAPTVEPVHPCRLFASSPSSPA